jgi:hypothetical protein
LAAMDASTRCFEVCVFVHLTFCLLLSRLFIA